MSIAAGRNPNHPPLGSSIKVEPIRDRKAIARIKKLLEDTPRDYCLFTLGINTAFRANELLSIRAGQVKYLNPGEVLALKQSKTKKYRQVIVNRTAYEALQLLLEARLYSDDDYLFTGQRGLLTVPTVSTMVKTWCKNAGLKGNYGSHTLRKTWGYWQRMREAAIPLLMEAFGHATQQQTLSYLCIQAQEVEEMYQMEL